MDWSKLKKWIYIIMILLFSISKLNSTILYVKYDAAGAGNGSSWTNAYLTLQEALDVSSSGNEIWVASGTYKPTFDYGLGGGSRYNHFRMKDGVAIYGGFAGTETAVSQRVNFGEGEVNETILSGDLNNDDILHDFSSNKSDNLIHIFYHPNGLNLNNTSILNGFTIKNAFADQSYPHERGGGIFNDESSPYFENLNFIDNYCDWGGGGINNLNCSPNILYCNFSYNNGANRGGGINNEFGASPLIDNCNFLDNIGGYNGAGINNENASSSIIKNCTFIRNNSNGSAIFCYGGSEVTATNCLIYNNYGSPFFNENCNIILNNITIVYNVNGWHGGAIFTKSNSTTIFNNCIIYSNSATIGNEFYLEGNSASITLNNCIYSNDFGYLYFDTGSTLTATNNNITTDPLFVDAANDDYRLTKISPCLDAGNNSYNSETYDIRGDYPRKLNKNSQSIGTIDIGAYEFRAGYDDLVVNTTSANDITSGSVTINASVFADLFTPILDKGIVWDTISTPTISLTTKNSNGTSNGEYKSNITDLQSNTTYYVRAYFINSLGTTYGEEISFTTLPFGIDEDGNQDGIADSEQSYVFNYFDETNLRYITIESFEQDSIFDVSQITAYEDKYHYPLGLMSFKVKASFSTIKIYYHGVSSLENYTYRKQKLDGTYYDYSHATFEIPTINGNPTAIVTLRLQDGKPGDLDGTINGIIYDPGGPALLNVGIPTLSEWARIILVGCMILFGGYYAYKVKMT